MRHWQVKKVRSFQNGGTPYNQAIQSRKCYETAKRHGKPIIVMEPVKDGTLATIPQDAEKLFLSCRPDLSIASWAIRFAASHDYVMLVLSGSFQQRRGLRIPCYINIFQSSSEKQAP